jgi:hypothetical protein
MYKYPFLLDPNSILSLHGAWCETVKHAFRNFLQTFQANFQLQYQFNSSFTSHRLSTTSYTDKVDR